MRGPPFRPRGKEKRDHVEDLSFGFSSNALAAAAPITTYKMMMMIAKSLLDEQQNKH